MDFHPNAYAAAGTARSGDSFRANASLSLQPLHVSREDSGKLRWHLKSQVGQAIKNSGPQTGRPKPAQDSTLRVDPGAGEPENVLHADHVLVHPSDLADLDHLRRAVAPTLEWI